MKKQMCTFLNKAGMWFGVPPLKTPYLIFKLSQGVARIFLQLSYWCFQRR